MNKHYPKSILFLLICLTSILYTIEGQSQTQPTITAIDPDGLSISKKLDHFISIYSEYDLFNGSVLVAHEGEVVYKKGFGFANMEWDIPNETDTKFRIASISKQFTAMLVMQLVAEHKLDLHSPISAYLPDYPKEKADSITIHHLLTHSSGTPDFVRFPNIRELERKRFSPMQLVELFSDLPLEFSPGSRYDYCNSGYVLLGVIMEEITNKSYQILLEERIFSPLQLEDTGYDDNKSIVKNRSTGYSKYWGKYTNATYLDMSGVYASGAIYSTVEDLYTWEQALYTDILLPNKYREMIFQPYVNARRRDYGYGWFIHETTLGESKPRIKLQSHGGGMDGVRTNIIRMPESKSSIILLANTESRALYEMNLGITNILNNLPYQLPDRSVVDATAERMEKEGIEKGKTYFRSIYKSDGYYLHQEELASTGYDFLFSGEPVIAAAIFELWIEAFPESWNAYDSYAETLLALDKIELAIDNYKKSIEINPGNQHGINALKKMGVNLDGLIVTIPLSELNLLKGEYKFISNKNSSEDMRIAQLKLVNNDLVYIENGRKYELLPLSKTEFTHQRSGIILKFNINEDKVSFILNENEKFIQQVE